MIRTDLYSLDTIKPLMKNNMIEWLGIEITEFDKNSISGKMPVDHRTHQPMGLLHGGASVVLAETLGSLGGQLCLEGRHKHCVGLEINANHIRSVKTGYVYGRAEIIHSGKKTQIWEIKITNEEKKLVCVSRLTLSIIET